MSGMNTKPGAAAGPPPGRHSGVPATPARAREPLLTLPVLILLGCGVLGWTAEGIVQPAIPLLVLDRGGDAVMVGIVAAMFALPTLILRPLIGHRIDRAGHGPTHRLGGTILTLAPLGFMVAPLLLVPIARLVNGVGWAMYGTANNVVLARLAPASRRAEASAYFNVAYAMGFLFGPPLGLFLYTSVADTSPFLAASTVASMSLVGAVVLARRTRDRGAEGPIGRPAETAPAVASPMPAPAPGAQPSNAVVRALARLFEPSAVPAMLGLALFMTSQALFLPFAPVYARETGFPVEQLALYYPAYAGLLIVGQLFTGRLSDRFGRVRMIAIGTLIACTGALVAVLPGQLLTFAVGGGLVALGSTFVTPSFAAAAMDRAPAARMGVAMATFSMGFQLAAGAGGALWGVVIGTVGYPWPFILTAILQASGLGLAMRYFRARPARAAVTPAG
jgi:MFS family permease